MATTQPKEKTITFDELPEHEKLIETARARTNNFTKAVDSYYRDTFLAPQSNTEGTGLPPWNNINATTQSIIGSIRGFQAVLDPIEERDRARIMIPGGPAERRKFLEEASLVPDPEKFPYEKGYGNDYTMFELLRRRPDPAVGAWEQKCRDVGMELEKGTKLANGETVTEQDWAELWNWAAITGNEMVHRPQEESEEEEEEEVEEDEEGDVEMGGEGKGKGALVGGGGRPVPLVHLLNYVSNGSAIPGNVR